MGRPFKLLLCHLWSGPTRCLLKLRLLKLMLKLLSLKPLRLMPLLLLDLVGESLLLTLVESVSDPKRLRWLLRDTWQR